MSLSIRSSVLAVSAALLLAVAVMVSTAPPAGALPDPCDAPLVGMACDAVDGVVGGVVGVPGAVAGQVADAAIVSFTGWIAGGITDLLRTVADAVFSGTEVDLFGEGEAGQLWFLDHYDTMATLALAVFAPMLLLAVLQAVFSQSWGVLVRALTHLPVAALGTAAAVTLVQALIDITDSFSSTLLAGTRTDTENFLSGIFEALTPTGGGGVMFGALFVGLFLAFATFVVWVELIVREAAIYLVVLFLPLGFAAYIWPALSAWLRRLVEVIVALILSKLVIAAALGLAASALANQEGFAALAAGAGMFLLAAFAPFALFRLIPIGEMAVMGALEGQGRKAVRAGTPNLSTAYYVQGMHRRFGGSSLAGRPGGSGGGSAGPVVGAMPSGGGGVGGGVGGTGAAGGGGVAAGAAAAGATAGATVLVRGAKGAAGTARGQASQATDSMTRSARPRSGSDAR